MRNVYKFLTVMTILLTMSLASSAQNSLTLTSLQKDASASTWHLLTQQGAVKIYYQYVDDGPIEFINFKAENTSSQALTVKWDYEFIDNGTTLPLNPDDSSVEFSVNGLQSVFGGVQSQIDGLTVFVRESGLALRMTTLKLNNLSVTQ
jgi:hypothetical protein